MIRERSGNLIELLDQKRALKNNLKKINAFKTRREEINKINKQLRPLVSTSAAFRAKDIGSADVNDQLVELKAVISKVGQLLAENPEEFTRAQNFKKLQEGVTALASDLEFGLRNIWFYYTRNLLPNENNELLEVLGTLSSFSDSVKQIRQINEEIAKLRNNLPLSEEDIDKFKELADKMKRVWDDIEAVPSDILAFLRYAVSSSGAPIDLLTDEVKEWLAKYNINKSFKVKLS